MCLLKKENDNNQRQMPIDKCLNCLAITFTKKGSKKNMRNQGGKVSR